MISIVRHVKTAAVAMATKLLQWIIDAPFVCAQDAVTNAWDAGCPNLHLQVVHLRLASYTSLASH